MSLFDRVNGQQASMQEQLRQLKSDPLSMARQKGYQIPDNLANDPRAMFQHLVQTGQIKSPMMQRLMPIMQRMGLK